MEKKQVAIETPVSVSGLTIVPVTSTSTYSWQNKAGVSFFGLKQPLYILIKSPKWPVKVFSIEGEEVSLGEIESNYPEIKASLEKFKV